MTARLDGQVVSRPSEDLSVRMGGAESLSDARYDAIAESCAEASKIVARLGDGYLSSVLGAAYRIALVCNENRAQVHWYRQVHRTACQRQLRLVQDLQSLIRLARQPGLTGERDGSPGLAAAGGTPKDACTVRDYECLIQRITDLLGRNRDALRDGEPAIPPQNTSTVNDLPVYRPVRRIAHSFRRFPMAPSTSPHPLPHRLPSISSAPSRSFWTINLSPAGLTAVERPSSSISSPTGSTGLRRKC